ncbi:pimeloyl-ACP methyl ester carboxylesterase [Hamadaea flava]|uniref:Alpha/beta hydrolase n=1 Tax=Hamadaea flava TaxID=1742688 RepID=A0ABV8LQK8_9ACTN|nr:pimeloyl-ACP methyl ester carboxylesterase [Hamadaea flava]
MRKSVLILSLLVALAGCGNAGTPSSSPSASDPSAAAREMRLQSANAVCVADQNRARLVTYPSVGGELGAGYLNGTGDTAVVLLHQAGGGLCQWLGYADAYAAKGMRGFAVDIRNESRVDDTVAAVAYLRSTGVRKVFLVGASMGGTTALAAAASIQPPVDGIVSLSGPAIYAGADAASAVKKLAMPVVFAAGTNDGNFATDAQSLYQDCASKQKKLILLPASDHGVLLMSRGMGDFVLAFVADPVAALSLTV